MFKSLIYFDSSKVAQYSAVLEGKKKISPRSIKVISGNTSSDKLGIHSEERGERNEVEGELVDNIILDCNKFEELLEINGKENYFDLVSNDFNVDEIPKTSIIRFEGGFNIPQEFDMIDIISKFKHINNYKTPQEEAVFNSIFHPKETNVPVFVSCSNFNNQNGFAKLKSKCLCLELEDIEDFEGEELTIIAKITSRKKIEGQPIVVFDVMKDSFSINRTLRRKLPTDKINVLQNIYSDRDVIIFEILAIYQ